MIYYSNGFTYKITEGEDGWFSIYRYHEHAGEYKPMIQAKTLDKAKDYCNLIEPSFGMQRL